VRIEQTDAEPSEFMFIDNFRIGREVPCELRIDSCLVSRVHAEVVFEEGAWWVRDLESTNGIYLDGQKVQQVRLDDQATLQLGRGTPLLHLSLGPSLVRLEKVAAKPPPAHPNVFQRWRLHQLEHHAPVSPELRSPPDASGTTVADASLSQVIDRYFDANSKQSAGEHTMMIRKAYAAAKKKHTRKYVLIIAGVLFLLVAVSGYAVYQKILFGQLIKETFYLKKEIDVEIAELRSQVDPSDSQLARLEKKRQRYNERYEGYVDELGLRRRLKSQEERLIHRTARIFNESEYEISATFIRTVKDTIRLYWQGKGRGRFRDAIKLAEEKGYTKYIVERLEYYNLPPEFFYLALLESDFIPNIVGPKTDYGYAKGMWQFIPETGRQYGLDPGVRADIAAKDNTDDRQDWKKATDAAARYLLDIQGTLTQASGLLMMASYNWGEHRVGPRLENLRTPRDAFKAEFKNVPEDPRERNYWRFLEVYGDRMPHETKDYVLKIFSAAVIGQDPQYFGFDFKNPLEPHLDRYPIR